MDESGASVPPLREALRASKSPYVSRSTNTVSESCLRAALNILRNTGSFLKFPVFAVISSISAIAPSVGHDVLLQCFLLDNEVSEMMKVEVVYGTHVWRRNVLSIWRRLIFALPPLANQFQLKTTR